MDEENVDHRAIEQLAYRLWQERGSPTGSPNEDWYRAEQELNQERFYSDLVSGFAMGPTET
jgi:hypothetical protein